MTAKLTAKAFVADYLGYARNAQHRTGVSAWVILAQWAVETGWGSSALAARHNLAGLVYHGYTGSQAIKGSRFAAFESPFAFLDQYVATMNLSYYHAVRAIPIGHDSEAGTIIPQCHALGRSPWAGGHYTSGGVMGGSLVAAWKRLRPIAILINEGHHIGVTVAHVGKPGE